MQPVNIDPSKGCPICQIVAAKAPDLIEHASTLWENAVLKQQLAQLQGAEAVAGQVMPAPEPDKAEVVPIAPDKEPA